MKATTSVRFGLTAFVSLRVTLLFFVAVGALLAVAQTAPALVTPMAAARAPDEDVRTLSPFTVIQQYIADLRQQLSVTWGDRKSKGNVSGRYTFMTGRLNGLFAGGGVRWAAMANIGRMPDGAPIKGPEDFVADAFLGYRARLMFLRAERKFTVQLNCYSAADEDVFQPLRYLLLYTGYARGLLERPRNFRFSLNLGY
jgi:hypothetical protein